jgi:hypothetical protein
MRCGSSAGLLVPVILVGVGVVLLLNTLEIVPWSCWSQLGRVWPVLLIVFGLGILRKNLRFR